MNQELKDAIIKTVQQHHDEFQLHNAIIEAYQGYIYTNTGSYAIGGQEVAQFISDFIKLYER